MGNTFYKGITIAATFFLLWLGISQIDWMKVFKVQQRTDDTEEKLGEFFWELISKSETEITDSIAVNAIDSIFSRICSSNNIDRSMLKVHIVKKDEINAFAMPGNHIVIFSGLITEAKNEAELSGVLCHEIAHIERKHVMKKLVKEVGLSVLISITTGTSNSEVISEILKLLTSSAYDRSLEKEADIQAVDYMVNAEINPEPLADFFYRLASDNDELSYALSWISTHPDLKERAMYILEISKDKEKKITPILTDSSWVKLKQSVE